MKILKHKGLLIKETGYGTGTVVFFKYLKNEDKEKCPHCNTPLEIEFSIMKDSPNWQSDITKVDTLD
jgi:hypothetical protein